MVFDVLLPCFKSNSIKDSIISILLNSNSLTTKEIYSRITKYKPISYQAIFKTLQELVEIKVLTKKQTKYFINDGWIRELKKVVERFENNITQRGFNPNAEVQTLEMNTLYEFFGGMLELMSSDVLYIGCKHRFGGGILRHLWWSLSFGDVDFEKFKYMLGSKDSYVVSVKDTPVDRWLQAYYLKTGGAGIKVGIKYNIEQDIAVVGHYVIQVFFEDKTTKIVDKLYSEVKDISDAINKGLLDQVLTKPTKIKVVITKNKDLSDIYLKKLVSFFGNPEEILSNPKHLI